MFFLALHSSICSLHIYGGINMVFFFILFYRFLSILQRVCALFPVSTRPLTLVVVVERRSGLCYCTFCLRNGLHFWALVSNNPLLWEHSRYVCTKFSFLSHAESVLMMHIYRAFPPLSPLYPFPPPSVLTRYQALHSAVILWNPSSSTSRFIRNSI